MRALLLLLACHFILLPAHGQEDERRLLRRISSSVYYSEHVLYVIDTEDEVDWPSYDSLFDPQYYLAAGDSLLKYFPADYLAVTFMANALEPSYVPNHRRSRDDIPSGIGLPQRVGGVPYDIIRYTLDQPIMDDLSLAVIDHEMGHAWGADLPPSMAGHWLKNSTVHGQMASSQIASNNVIIQRIHGNERDGFRWEPLDKQVKNQTDVYSKQLLYAMGLEPQYPDTYLLNDPVYREDGSMGYSSVTKYDHEYIVSEFGERDPDYRTSPKRFRVAFIYLARSLSEVRTQQPGLEQAIKHFVYSDSLASSPYNLRVPFLVLTSGRASLNARLADLDGNREPSLEISETYLSVRSDEKATISYTAEDPDTDPLSLRCLQTDWCRFEEGGQLTVGPFDSTGAHFLTVLAEDSEGKRAFSHAVVDVQPAPVATETPPSSTEDRLDIFPNPAFDSFRIRFSLADAGFAELSLYGVSGRKIATLANRRYPAGSESMSVDTSDLASGVYALRLFTPRGLTVRTLVVVE